MNAIIIMLMLASFTSGIVWIRMGQIYDYFSPPETEVVEEKKDNNQQIILVPAQQLVRPTVRPKPSGIKTRREREDKESDLFCSTTAGPLRDAPL